jgi:hypothetical protein
MGLVYLIVLIIIIVVALAFRNRKKTTDSHDSTPQTYPDLTTNTTTRCNVCKHDNPPQARFCGNCGAALINNPENKQ